MNILFLLRLWPVYGGGETVTICLANEMISRGWEVHVAFFEERTNEHIPFINSRIKTHRIDKIDCNEFHANLNDADKVRFAIKEIIVKHKIQAVINQWLPVEYIKGLKDFGQAKIITCLHQALYTPILDSKGAKGVIKRIIEPLYLYIKKREAVNSVMKFLPHVDNFVFLSPSFQKQFLELSNYKDFDHKLASIPNPLVFDRQISPDEYTQKENIVLLVGRMLEGQKKISRALEIWKRIESYEEFGSWRFILVGDGPDITKYKNFARQNRLKQISFEGFKQPLQYYLKSKIFLMTSAFEGFGMTLIESAQFGVVPIVMDSYLSLHDIIRDGYNGIITKKNDLYEFTEKITFLMRNDEYRNKLAYNGLESCNKFSAKNIVDMWYEILKRDDSF